MIPEILNDLRPYYDSEINAAMCRIADSEHFPLLASFVFPDKNPDEVRAQIRTYTTVDEFQLQVMKVVNERIIERSITHFSYSGLDKLNKNDQYLFVSNHRDIVLDAMLLQYALHLEGHRSSEITFGNNLMHPQVVVDIGKSNKMFKVIRSGNMKEFYFNSLNLSKYIYYTLTEKHESVWIAQRNGRTKNGVDTTDPGIIRMFYMCCDDHPIQILDKLKIVPISISYEYEPCDFLKTAEIYLTQKTGKYEKKPLEDLNSILTGIMQPKGEVHIHFGNPITKNNLQPFAHLANNKLNQKIASLIDKQVLTNYKLSKNNYIAHDMRSGKTTFSNHYSASDLNIFSQYMEQGLNKINGDEMNLRSLFLEIYANPVDVMNI